MWRGGGLHLRERWLCWLFGEREGCPWVRLQNAAPGQALTGVFIRYSKGANVCWVGQNMCEIWINLNISRQSSNSTLESIPKHTFQIISGHFWAIIWWSCSILGLAKHFFCWSFKTTHVFGPFLALFCPFWGATATQNYPRWLKLLKTICRSGKFAAWNTIRTSDYALNNHTCEICPLWPIK